MTHFGAMLLATVLWANIHWLPLLMQLGWASSAFILGLNLHREHEKARQILLWASLLSLTFPVLFYSSDFIFIKALGRSLDFPRDLFISWGLRFAGGILAILVWLRFAQPRMNQVLDLMKAGTKLERNKKTDVREIHKFLPKPVQFNPANFVNLKKGIFLGLDEDKKPYFLDFFPDNPRRYVKHVQVVGTTGGGKGIALALMAAQLLERGEAIFFMDPKNDEWAPHVLYDAAKRLGKPFHYIDLNPPCGPQLNPFHGATREQIFELFQAGFSLVDRGSDADFHAIADRREANKVAKLMAEKGLNAAQAYTAMDGNINAEKFDGRLREIAETPSINATNGQGVDLAKVIREGGCVYFVGSLRNDITKMIQRLILVRLYQLVEERDRIDGDPRLVAVFLDELKFHISRPAIDGMSTARDKGLHFVLAHQSRGDLEDCPKDLTPKAVVDAIEENCKRRIVYQVQSPETARWLAEQSGEIQVDDEVRRITRNVAQAEIVDPERTIRQAERNFIDTNMLLNLPERVAVVYGQGLAKFITIQPLQVKKSREAVQIRVVEGTEPFAVEDAIDVSDNKPKLDSHAAAAIDI